MISELSTLIQEYLNSKSHRTLHRLSRDSGVPYPTIRRIANEEASSCETDTCIKICRVLMEDVGDIVNFCKKHYGEFGDFLEKLYLENEVSDILHDNGDLEDFDFWLALCYSERDCGVSKEELVPYMGTRKMNEVLQKLEGRALLRWEDGRAFLEKKNFFFSSVRASKAEFSHFLRLFNSEQVGEDGFHLSDYVMQLNDKGRKKLEQLARAYTLEVAALEKNAEYKRGRLNMCFSGVITGEIL